MTQPPPAKEPEFAAFLAIDWADKEHAWALEVPGTGQRETGTFKHTPEAIEAWATSLAVRFEGRRIAVGLEQSRGALVYALSQYGHLVLYPIPTTTSSRYRAAMCPSGSKDDPKDADLLLDLMVRHRDRFHPLKPDNEPTRKLRALVEKRRQLVDQKTGETNRVTDLLKLYFPQALQWLDELGSTMAGAALERWPTLEQWQAEDPQQLRKFFHQHNCRSETRIQERLEQIQRARPATGDHAVIDPAVIVLQICLRVVAALREGIARLERAIEEVVAAHPDYPIFASFPAAGPVMAPRLLAAFGSRRDRFADAGELQSFSGIAPVTSRSGDTQCWIHFRWACPKFLRQSFHEYAELSIQKCAWARAFYDQQRAKGNGHHAAVRSLAFKWIRILYRCWRAGTPYQENIYVSAVQRRSPAARPAAAADGRRQKAPAADASVGPTAVEAQGRPQRAATSAVTARSAQPSVGRAAAVTQPGACLALENTVHYQLKSVAGFWKFSLAGT